MVQKIGNFKLYRGHEMKQEIHQVPSPYQNKSLYYEVEEMLWLLIK